MELLEQWDAYSVHAGYYIERHVNAAVQRCLSLAPYFVDVSQWFNASTKPPRRIHFWHTSKSRSNNSMISNFFGSDRCLICGARCSTSGKSKASVCGSCIGNGVKATQVAMRQLRTTEYQAHTLAQKCSNCNNCFEDIDTYGVGTERKSPASNTHSRRTVLETPIANCICTDCPITFERHRVAEKRLQASALAQRLDLL